MAVEETAVSVESLLEAFEAPATFDINLPNGQTLTCRGFQTYADKRQFEKDQNAFVSDLIAAKNAAIKASDNDLLPVPFRPYSHLIIDENLKAAYTIHRICISPGFTPIEALRLTGAPALVSFFMDQWTWHSSKLLMDIRAQLYGEAKKD